MKKNTKNYDLALQESAKYFNVINKDIEEIFSEGHRLMLWLFALNAFLIKDIIMGNTISFLSILFVCLLPFSLYVFYNLYQCLFVPRARSFEGIQPIDLIKNNFSKKDVLEIYKGKTKRHDTYYLKILQYYERARKSFFLLLALLFIASITKAIVSWIW